MRKIIFIILSGISCFCAYSQDPDKELEVFKQRFKIYYVADPNSAKPWIHTIDATMFPWADKDIIFGTDGNNQMNRSAELLFALFDESTKSYEFQDAVFFALNLSDKPIDLYFINDSEKGIVPATSKKFGFYEVSSGNKSVVWPGTYKSSKLGTAQHNAIVIGESILGDLQQLKEMFCRMVTRVCIDDYGPEKFFLTKTFKTKLKQTEDMVVSFPTNDVRKTFNHALANAFSLYGSKSLRARTFPWAKNKDFMLSIQPSDEKTPVDATLYSYITKTKPGTLGFQLRTTDFDVPAVINKEYRKFGESDFIDDRYASRYLMRNDVYLGLILYEFIRVLGPRKFLEGIKLNNSQILKAPSAARTALLFENMSLVMLKGKTYQDLAKSTAVSQQGESFAIALFDLYGPFEILGSRSSLASDFSEAFEEITGGKISTGLAEHIIPYYLSSWQSKLQQKYQSRATDPKLTFMQEMANFIHTTMGMKIPLY